MLLGSFVCRIFVEFFGSGEDEGSAVGEGMFPG